MIESVPVIETVPAIEQANVTVQVTVTAKESTNAKEKGSVNVETGMFESAIAETTEMSGTGSTEIPVIAASVTASLESGNVQESLLDNLNPAGFRKNARSGGSPRTEPSPRKNLSPRKR